MEPEDCNPSLSDDDPIAGLYDALRILGGRALGFGSRLDPTDLVHQAWVRLAHSDHYAAMPRPEFLAMCATVMRRIAVDEGRRRVVERLEPGRITLTGLPVRGSGAKPDVDLLELDEALIALKLVDDRWARIVELRFFGGMTGDEVADALKLSRRTVVREWDLARAWLKRRLG
ncbi:MAG: RNA polymerase sigma-70 factor (ECF subfamily) [Planctomycetota bacterium]|jgi:RNA polymerase sigma-70 factor (ECF subfamily)